MTKRAKRVHRALIIGFFGLVLCYNWAQGSLHELGEAIADNPAPYVLFVAAVVWGPGLICRSGTYKAWKAAKEKAAEDSGNEQAPGKAGT